MRRKPRQEPEQRGLLPLRERGERQMAVVSPVRAGRAPVDEPRALRELRCQKLLLSIAQEVPNVQTDAEALPVKKVLAKLRQLAAPDVFEQERRPRWLAAPLSRACPREDGARRTSAGGGRPCARRPGPFPPPRRRPPPTAGQGAGGDASQGAGVRGGGEDPCSCRRGCRPSRNSRAPLPARGRRESARFRPPCREAHKTARPAAWALPRYPSAWALSASAWAAVASASSSGESSPSMMRSSE